MGVHHINGLAELDARLAECNAATTMAERRRVFASFSLNWRPKSSDPFSPEYRDEQLDLYRSVSGRTYQVSNEVSTFDIDAAVHRPYPFAAHDPEAIGSQLIAIGSLIRRLEAIPAGGRILEFGPGWGNTTLAMAMAGFDVTAVDIEKNFCELIQRRALKHNVDINVINSDFMWAETSSEAYDAVVFFECFHHCDDHMRLLRALDRIVKPGGRIYFAGEPIGSAFPIPWGLRLDGEALYAIRHNGWLELGFNDRYFQDALRSLGWSAILHKSEQTFIGNVWEARRSEEFQIEVSALDRSIGAVDGNKQHRGIVADKSHKNWVFCGPFCALPAGRWLGSINLDVEAGSSGSGRLQVCCGSPEKIIAECIVEMPSKELCIRFETTEAVDSVQLRYFSDNPSSFVLSSISIRPDDSNYPRDTYVGPENAGLEPLRAASKPKPFRRLMSKVFRA